MRGDNIYQKIYQFISQQLPYPVKGAILLFLVEAAITVISDNSSNVNYFRHFIAAVFLGTVLGLIYEIAQEQRSLMQEIAQEQRNLMQEFAQEQRNQMQASLVQLEKVRKALTYQEKALNMLLSGGHYSELLSKLIEMSIESR